MRSHTSRRKIFGFTLQEVMAVTAIISTIQTGAYVRAKQKAFEVQCVNNLQQIGKTIQMHHISEGTYPKAKFYPDDAFKDADSIITILENSGSAIPKEMWICPGAPDPLRAKGLTFVYNDILGGRSALSNPSKAWVLIEVNCVSKKAPAPHPGGYNVLFADGRVVTTKVLPPSITKKQSAAIEGIREKLMEGCTLAGCEHEEHVEGHLPRG